MAGSLVTQLTSSNAAIHTNYFDPLINQNTNFMAMDLRKPGIYSGGYLTWVSNSSFTLSPLTCEIQDSGGSGNQIRVVTTSPISITGLSSTNPATMIVLRWTYSSASSAANYPSVYTVAQGSQNATDLIVGTAYYSGYTLSPDYGVQYPSYMRSDPANILDLGLKVEPISSYPYAATSGVMLRAGRASYGTSAFQIYTQPVPVSASFTSGDYAVVLLQITAAGAVSISLPGTPSASLPATAPSYNNLITLAEITMYNSSGSYTIVGIRDTRSWQMVTPYTQTTGQVVQTVWTQDQTPRALTAPSFNSSATPTTSGGAIYSALSTSFTPKLATSTLIVEVEVQFAIEGNFGQGSQAFVFANGTVLAGATTAEWWANGSTGSVSAGSRKVPIRYAYAPGSISPITFTVYVGDVFGTAYINQSGNGAGYYGNTLISSIKITEIHA